MIDLDAHMRSLAQVLGARALEGAIRPAAPRRAPRGWRRHVRRSKDLGLMVDAQPPRIARTLTPRILKRAGKSFNAMIGRLLVGAPEQPFTRDEMRRAVAGAFVACGVWRSYSRSLRRRWWRVGAPY